MCGGPESTKRKHAPPGFSMETECHKEKEKNQTSSSVLLELSASDDLPSFKQAVEADGASLDEPSHWYGRRLGSRKLGFEDRTPLMIAAMYGSVEVIKYILSVGSVDVNRSCGSDGATALHCAASGGAPSSAEIIRLLLDAAASADAVDAAGRLPGDVIAPSSPVLKPQKPTLETMLKKGCLETNESSPLDQSVEKKEKEKEYPIDQSLPDIKNGIYGTDEFRMYSFKVKPCSRAYSHDWTECPFVHPGENARRRDPRKYHYSCVPCPEFRKGSCRQGDACEYAHGVFECWLHPAQYRTRLCKDETSCSRRVCFFAHKPEELRPLYPSTGSALPSPRSSSSASLDMLLMSPLAFSGNSMSPMSPSSSAGIAMGGLWQNQPAPPTLQLPGSRLKSAMSARDFEMDADLIGGGVDVDELSNLSALAALSGSRSGKFNHVGSILSPSLTPTNLDELFASMDPAALSQLQGISALKSAHLRQNLNLNQQLQSGYSSPVRTTPTSLGLDSPMSVAAAVMNSRSAAFAKRSQSFSERALMNRYSGLSVPSTPASTQTGGTANMVSDWGSPSGKVDWGIQGEELQKLRRSASFGIRSNGAAATTAMGGLVDEPDVSWVQSLVKDGPSAGWSGNEQQQQRLQQYNLMSRGGANEFHPSEVFSPWAEQLYVEQEQMA